MNPAYGLIANFRRSMLGEAIDWYSLAVSGVIGVILFLVGCLYFRRVERDFADIISPPRRRHLEDSVGYGLHQGRHRGLRLLGPNLIRNFSSCPQTEVVAVCDASPARL